MNKAIDYKTLFYRLLRIRLVEEAIAKRYAEQEMRCPVHLSIGQEAIAVGVCALLSQTDFIMSTHRAHAHYLAKGGSLKAMIAELYGKKTGCTSGKGGSMHLVDLPCGMLGSTPIVGGSFPVAVGLALANQMKKNDSVTAVFFGEGMTEEGVFSEGLNFAALKKLPIIFVCENNLYSVYSPISVRQPVTRDLSKLAEAHGILAKNADGNRLESVVNTMNDAVEHVKSGQGPVFLEFSTYRWLEHCGPNYDNHIGYRTEEEFLAWKKKCPLELLKSSLLEQKQLTDSEWIDFNSTIKNEIEEAFLYAHESPFPDQKELFDFTYAEEVL
ncbi:MAG: Acetoin:2,6-dichlorophenolindophenol oxidoreductase subunit alpha [Chlamydiae bacterium]|nr:Acetoin:2,6-dichlorophenolindophenol oxidoreductase subunit alpha [Chlamydiota bacterium]